MVRQKMYRRIQQRKEQGASISEIARELDMDRKTVAKYYHMGPDGYREYCAAATERGKRVAQHRGEILELYEANGFAQLNMAAVYDYLVERHGRVPYTEKTLRNYIRYLRENGTLVFSDRTRMFLKVPEMPFGKQLQLDFGEWVCRSGLKLWIFSAVLSASRYKYMAFAARPFRTLDVIEHLLDCFGHLGGLVEELVIDQDALLVASENSGEIIFTKQFAQFIDEMGLGMYVCRKADPQSKGKVENTIKYGKHNFLAIRDFENLESAARALSKWLERRANGAISQATKCIPRELLKEEREHLLPLRNSIFRKDTLAGREPRLVNEHSYISVGGNQYSVPSVYRGRSVEIYRTTTTLFIFDENSGIQVAEHAVAAIPGTMVTDRAHFRSTEHSAAQLRQQARGLVDNSLWRRFERENAQAFPRYTRDQAIEAKRYFSGELEEEVLCAALEFCLENRTFSYASLKDTYQAFLSEFEQAEVQSSLPVLSLTIPSVDVTHRSLATYQKVIATGGNR